MEKVTRLDSELSKIWTAAFLSWSKKQEFEEEHQYSKWYQEFLGSNRGIPDWGDTSDWISSADLDPNGQVYNMFSNTHKIRIGFIPKVFEGKDHKPYAWLDSEDNVLGFEYELAEAIVNEIAEHYGVALEIEWEDFECPDLTGEAFDNGLMANFLSNELSGNDLTIDIGLSGIIDKQITASYITTAYPTLTFFTGVMYTGKLNDGEDLTSLMLKYQYNGTTEEWKLYDDLALELRNLPQMTFMALPGPSLDSAEFFMKNIYGEDADLENNLISAESGAAVLEAIENQDIHMVVADAIILGDVSTLEPPLGVNLNFNTRFENMEGLATPTSVEHIRPNTDFMGPFMLKD